MSRSRPRLQDLKDPARLRVLAAPLALQLLNALQGQREATAAELAEQVGRQREVVYYHLRRMVAAGIVRVTGQRATERRPVAVYRVSATDVRIDASDETADWREALERLYRSAIRALERDVSASVAAGHRPGGGARAEFQLMARRLRLDEEGLREMNALFATVSQAALRRATARKGPVYSFAFALVPVVDRRRPGTSGDAGTKQNAPGARKAGKAARKPRGKGRTA